jgi:hypothetical protein
MNAFQSYSYPDYHLDHKQKTRSTKEYNKTHNETRDREREVIGMDENDQENAESGYRHAYDSIHTKLPLTRTPGHAAQRRLRTDPKESHPERRKQNNIITKTPENTKRKMGHVSGSCISRRQSR